MEMKPVAWIVDGSYLLHRTFHAIQLSFTNAGFPNNAVVGTVQHILRIIDECDPDALVVVMDRPEPTFRHLLSPEYKANRSPYGKELTDQIPWIIRFLEAYGISVVSIPGYEGDDMVGTLASMYVDAGYLSCILTGDKDMMQLVSEDVCLVDRFKRSYTGVQEVYEKFGVYPHSIADMLALMGDRVDGIRGVTGVGQVGAVNLIAQYGSLDNIIAQAPNIKGMVGRRLVEETEHLRIARQLTGIVTNLDLGVTIDQLVIQPSNVELLRELNLEFWGNTYGNVWT